VGPVKVTRRLPYETTRLPWRFRPGPEPWQGSVKQLLYGLWMVHLARKDRIREAGGRVFWELLAEAAGFKRDGNAVPRMREHGGGWT
jgi:hypothetical protein